jgi:hypothetical protein
LVLREKRGLAEIEKTLGLPSPDNDFRNSLIGGPLWAFYRRCLPKISRRKAMTGQRQHLRQRRAGDTEDQPIGLQPVGVQIAEDLHSTFGKHHGVRPAAFHAVALKHALRKAAGSA